MYPARATPLLPVAMPAVTTITPTAPKAQEA
jgi:hypothetical protein